MLAYALAQDVLAAAGDTGLSATNSAEPGLNLAMWSGIAGFLAPLLVALVQQPGWPSFVRALVLLAGSIGLASVTAALEGKLTGERWVASSLLIASTAIVTYQSLWKNVAPQLEAATSSRAGRPAPDPVQ